MKVLINYGIGNTFSILNAFQIIGVELVLSSCKEDIEKADLIILPGVGSFGEAMKNIKNHNLKEVLVEKAKNKTPFLGLCLGMQILFEESEESPGIKGLGLLKGLVKKLPLSVRIPHIGWNKVKFKETSEQEKFFYFAHSYYCFPEEKSIIAGETFYGLSFPSIVKEGNILGVQFHPEKSGKNGIEFLRRWINDNYTCNRY